MRIAIFAHSFISDWNHGNAHFLRGVASELQSRGMEVSLYEPHDAWSLQKLRQYQGDEPVRMFHDYFPSLNVCRYSSGEIDLYKELDGTDLIIVHEWNDHELVAQIGRYRKANPSCRLLFHDTHHRSVTDPLGMSAYDLSGYDAVLAFGEVVRDIYLKNSWIHNAYVWHEAADVRIFRPLENAVASEDVVWIGNWGDEERNEELREFLFEPVKTLGLRCRVHGVRYSSEALSTLEDAGIEYAGWIPNYKVPRVFSRYKFTVHIPRRPYVRALIGVPTIRPFEALASEIPLICSPWQDCEGLFCPGEDFLVARDGKEMMGHMRRLLNEPDFARELVRKGRDTVLKRHTCAHRVDELFGICGELGLNIAEQEQEWEAGKSYEQEKIVMNQSASEGRVRWSGNSA